MKKGFVTLFVIVAIVIVAVILVFVNIGKTNVASTSNDNTDGSSSGNGAGPRAFTVIITDGGYSLQSLNINVGDTVIWRHEGTQENWPASAMHPTHKVYPGSDIEKCGTDEENLIFDACHGLANGDEWSFTFDEAGNWGYHDHLHATLRGTIVVQ